MDPSDIESPLSAEGDAAQPGKTRPWLFQSAFVVAGLMGLVAVAFFIIGLADGSVSSYNIVLWLGLLSVVAASLIGGFRLHAAGRTGAAVLALSILAVPGLIGGFLLLLLLVSNPRWN